MDVFYFLGYIFCLKDYNFWQIHYHKTLMHIHK